MIPGVKIVRDGDATRPVESKAVIAQVVNNLGKYGKGFSGALSLARNNMPEEHYRKWHSGDLSDQEPFNLGSVQIINTTTEQEMKKDIEIYVANMLAQDGIRTFGDPPWKVYVNYVKLHEALYKVFRFCYTCDYTLHMPRIGCGLAGGNWQEIEKIIEACMAEYYVRTYVYDPPENKIIEVTEVKQTEVGW